MAKESELVLAIKVRLTERSKTIAHLSEKLNIDYQTLCNYLSGKTSMKLSTYIKIANYLDIKIKN